MDRSLAFRRSLRARWMTLLGLVAPVSAPRSSQGVDVAIDGAGANTGGTARPTTDDGAPQAGLRPDVAALSGAQRAALAQAWRRDGLEEHASVAAFGRFALELLAAGAPSALVAGAQRAALDEVRHARLCLGLASTYAGEPIVPGPFDFGRGLAPVPSLPALTARTFVEGCVGETLAAVRAEEQLAVATDPAVRAVLAMIVEDGTRHADLAWRTLAWALEAGGEPVRAAVRAAIGRATVPEVLAAAEPGLGAHGRLDGATARTAMARALREIVLPCAQGLLDGAMPDDEDEDPPCSLVA